MTKQSLLSKFMNGSRSQVAPDAAGIAAAAARETVLAEVVKELGFTAVEGKTFMEVIAAEIAIRDKALENACGELQVAQTELTAKIGEIATLKQQHIEALAAKDRSVGATASGQALDLVAAQGVPAAALPAADGAATGTKQEKLDAIRAEIAACTDPAKKGVLAAKAAALRNAA